MLKSGNHIDLNSAEIGSLWAAFMNDDMNKYVLEYFLQNIESNDIKKIVKHALDLSQKHTAKIADIFVKDEIPVPHGMSKDDVNLNAPRLFTDIFYLYYVYQQSVFGLSSYSSALSFSARLDVRSYFQDCMESTVKLQNKAVELMLSKGLFIRAPYLHKPDSVEFVDSTKYLKGFLGQKRTVNAIEIMNIYNNIQNNHIGNNVMTAFSQVAQSNDVKKFMEKGIQISEKHIKKLRQVLIDNSVTLSSPWDYEVTDSTTPPFSDKLMVFMTVVLLTGGLANYGIGLSQSPRRDIGAMYTAFMADIADFSEDGARIMIENRWLEKIPQALDRRELIKH